jgi:uncharacterized membrane protein
MNFRDPNAMSLVISRVLRYGVLLSAVIVLFGTLLLLAASWGSASEGYLTYYPSKIPHGAFDISLQGLASGLAALEPFSYIELGVIVLLATPVSRVAISVLLFAAERDRLYMAITFVVLALLLFSMLATPFIPIFQA